MTIDSPSLPAGGDFPGWAELEQELGCAVLEPRAASHLAALPLLDGYAAARFMIALQAAGLFAVPGDFRSNDDIEAALRPVSGMIGQLASSLAILERQGWLAREGGGFRVAGRAASADAEAARLADALARDHADKGGIVAVVDGTVPRMLQVIAGALPPTQVIFPDGSMDLVLDYYTGHPLADCVNLQCARAVARLARGIAARPGRGRPVRVLEVGAGTGASTRMVLDELDRAGIRTDYLFTDISGVFVGRAQRAFGRERPEMRFDRYDIEELPERSAGLGTFDLVLAANAVHATADIGVSLKNLVARLDPGGFLVLNEITTPQDHLTLAFGILPGWWRATDRRSAAGPLLTAADWRRRLADRFDTRLIVGPAGPEGPLQSVIIASPQADGRQSRVA